MTRTSERITFSIHTEHKDNLPALVSDAFECFAIFEGTGFWKGIPEKAARIDIIGTHTDRIKVQTLARWIQIENEQEAIYVTETAVTLTELWRG